MKPGWQTSTLGDVLATLRNGINCKQDKSGKGDKISRIESISDASFDLEKVGYAELSERDKDRYRLQPGDILFSHINSVPHVGKTAVFDSAELVYHGVNLLLMRPKNIVISAYLEYALKYLFEIGYWRGVCKQSVNQASVNQQDISRVRITYPKSFHEQQRVVAVLDKAFAALTTAKANTEKNLLNARALLENQLRRFFAEGSSSWGRRVPLSSILSAQPRNGWSPPLEYQNGTGTPVLTLSSVTGFEYDGTRVKLTSAPTQEDAHYWLRPGELLITRSNTRDLVGHVAIYDGNPAKGICCDLIMKMQVDPRVADTRFIYYYLRSPEARTYFTTIAHGASSTMKKIGKATVQNIRVPLPPLEQQKSTATMLDQIAGSAKQLQAKYIKKRDALGALQRALLHRAFTGNL